MARSAPPNRVCPFLHLADVCKEIATVKRDCHKVTAGGVSACTVLRDLEALGNQFCNLDKKLSNQFTAPRKRKRTDTSRSDASARRAMPSSPLVGRGTAAAAAAAATTAATSSATSKGVGGENKKAKTLFLSGDAPTGTSREETAAAILPSQVELHLVPNGGGGGSVGYDNSHHATEHDDDEDDDTAFAKEAMAAGMEAGAVVLATEADTQPLLL